MDDLEEAVAGAARALRQTARMNKRIQAAHRRQARDNMTALTKLQEACQRHGIKLIITTEDEGNNSHGRTNP